jgi:serine/threonine protein kinase
MSLSAGERLGPYEILASIGKGGMGEVWKARDTRLNREVAIKVSQAEFTNRFQREASAIAALNHPHICTLYDVGPNYLVMEYVDGTPLSGPLPIERALPLMIQLTQALEAAHRKGIVHRDLKPANILGTKSGIKVLDFGLAKLEEPAAALGPNAATAVTPLSRDGVIAGTLEYMAPEQLQGGKVDARADLFAFGCVLYELITGKMAFSGDNAASVITAIMSKDPPAISSLQPLTPRALDRVLRRCFAKEPDDRWQSARDLRDALESLDQPVATHAPSQRSRSRLPWVIAAACALAFAATSILHFREAPTLGVEIRADIVTPPSTVPYDFALSPDGRKIAYVATNDGASRLWVRFLESNSVQALPGTEGATLPFWSPDSKAIGFYADTNLKRVNPDGGLPQVLHAGNMARSGGTWSPSGVIVFTRGGRLISVSASGGQYQSLTTSAPGQTGHRASGFLPDGKRFLYFATGAGQGVYLGSLDGSPAKFLTTADSPAEYLASGWLLWVQEDALVARRFDASRAELSGDPVTLARPVAVDPAGTYMAFSVSKTGLIAWRAGEASRRQLVWFSRKGERTGVLGQPDDADLRNPRISPDGRKVAVVRGTKGKKDIWLLDEFRQTRLTFDATDVGNPLWSPDSRFLTYTSNKDGGRRRVYQKPADGSGAENQLMPDVVQARPQSWSPDGRLLLWWTGQQAGDLMVLPMDGDRKSAVFLSTPHSEHAGAISPDGKWAAYHSNESGRFEVYIRSFPGPGGVWQVSTDRGTFPRWSADSKELYFIGSERKLMAAPITVQGSTIVPGKAVVLFQLSLDGAEYDVSRDGRFLVNLELGDAAIAPITLLMNWKPPK